MPNNRLSVLLETFDKKPRHSKSASSLATISVDKSQAPTTQWRKSDHSKSRERLNIMQEYHFKPLPPAPQKQHEQSRLPPQHRRLPTPVKPVTQLRASTAPTMDPPDELFLKMIRRRSANARLEEQRIQAEKRVYGEEEIMSVAIASALPPHYFDMPPACASPDSLLRPLAHVSTDPPSNSRGTITKFRDEELFSHVGDSLNLQIDETIAQYVMLKISEPTPTRTRSISPMSATVSPINDIDHLYLERRRRKQKKR
ncbi:hypothetical protein H2198_003181 [Neophaeococcomyces mojaviensis]|uniref:Uncharacterized protein n=1 Tax=Neophaeococcomyces mojaviensis TaxID=3383035 RepID=A0ACC3ABY5_9EURO|nr:hypothetical protein H2198_003181 [Knufia sp. JES_112]